MNHQKTLSSYLRICSVVLALGLSLPIAQRAFAKTPSEDASKKLLQSESVTVTVEIEQNFLLYLPEDYEKDDQQSIPLMLFLHGAGERGDDLARVKVHGPLKLIEQGRKFPCIVVAPQCREKRRWETYELSALLDYLEANYRVDNKRIYVTGLSMGGFGTWALALHEPNRFAAFAPICGGGDARLAAYLDKVTAPIWAFHGAKDTVVPVNETHDMVEAMKKKGVDVKETIYPEVGHNAWDNAYADEELYKWMFAQERE